MFKNFTCNNGGTQAHEGYIDSSYVGMTSWTTNISWE